MTELIGAPSAPPEVSDWAIQARSGTSRGSGAWGAFILALVALLAAVDRQTFSVLLVPIQKQIHVNDAAMGALTGAAFAIVYAVVALPLARLADRTNRRTLLAIAVAVWSAATMVCGLAGNFLQLLLTRVAVGSAESVQAPASMSMIADMFSARRRGTAIGVMTVGSALGFAGGSALAGFLNDRFNWHIALMAVGAPGLILGLVLLFTVREPVRGAHDGLSAAPTAQESLLQCVRRCMRIRTLYPFTIGWVCLQFCYSGWLTWVPAFLMRVDHLSASKMGAVFGSIIACAIAAALVAGPLSDWLAKRGARWRLYYCCGAMVLSIPLLMASTLVGSLGSTIGLLVAYTVVSGGITTVAAATYLSFAPPTMRGFMTAAMGLFAAILGAGAAPALFGAVNDVLKIHYGDQSLRYTLLLAPLAMTVAFVMFLIASRTLDDDVKAVSAGSASD